MQVHIHEGLVFDYVNMPPLNHRLILLTKDNRIEYGPWRGAAPGFNKTYKGWHGLPARDLEIERQQVYK